MCTGSRSGLCKQGKPHLTPYLKGGSHPAPCLRAHSKNPQSLSNTGVAQTSPHSAPLCQHAQTSTDPLSARASPLRLSKCPLSHLALSQMWAVMKTSFITSLPVQVDMVTSPTLFSIMQIITSNFKLCCPGIMTWYPIMSLHNYTFPFYSWHVLIWIQNTCVLFPQHSIKRASMKLGLFFEMSV